MIRRSFFQRLGIMLGGAAIAPQLDAVTAIDLPPSVALPEVGPVASGEIAASLMDIKSIMGMMVDRQPDVLYDRVLLPAGKLTPSRIFCFRTPVSLERTRSDTNMLSSGCLLPPWDIVVQRLSYVFTPESSTEKILTAYHWELSIMDKIYARQPMLSASWRGDASEIIAKPSALAQRETWEFGAYSRFIPPMVYFGVTISGEPFIPEKDIEFYVFIGGLMDRPVQ